MRWLGAAIVPLGVLLAGCDGLAEPGAPAAIDAPAELVLRQGQSLELEVVVRDLDGRPIPAVPLSFTSSDGSVVAVTREGVATAEGPGEATLYVAAGPASIQIAVTVYGHPEGIPGVSVPVTLSPFGAAISRDGRWLVTRGSGATLVGGSLLHPGQVVDTIAVGSVPTQVTFAPDGLIAYVTNQFSQSVGVVDVANRQQVWTIHVPGNPFFVTVSPDGGRVYATLNTNDVVAIDAATRTVIATIPVGNAPNGLAFSPDASRLYVSAFFHGQISEIDVAGNAVLRTFTVGGKPQGIAVSADGLELYVANEAGALQVVRLATGTVEATVWEASGGFGLALSPDGAQLYVTLTHQGLVAVVDVASRSVVQTIGIGGNPRRVAFDRLGTAAVVANEAGWVHFIR